MSSYQNSPKNGQRSPRPDHQEAVYRQRSKQQLQPGNGRQNTNANRAGGGYTSPTFTAQAQAHNTVDPSRMQQKRRNTGTATPYGWLHGSRTAADEENDQCV